MQLKSFLPSIKMLFVKKPVLLVIVMVFSAWTTYVALPPEVEVEIPMSEHVIIPPAPTAASLGKYAEFPVNEASGTPDISIPLYHIKSGQLDLPITLSYHPSGIKVSEDASWVGLGWSLNAGGVIARTMRGLPDESSSAGYLKSWDYIKSYNSGSSGFDQPGHSLLKNMAHGELDGEPDLFNFNFAGHSGSFMIKPDGTPVTVPYQPLDIKLVTEYTFAGMASEFPTIDVDCRDSYYFQDFEKICDWDVCNRLEDLATLVYKNFSGGSCEDFQHGSPTDSVFYASTILKIKDENGITYKFGRPEKTEVQLKGADQNYLSSWFLTEIVSADHRDTILLEYRKNAPTLSYGVNYSETIKSNMDQFGSPSPNCQFSQVRIIDQAVLTKIIFNGGEVNFNSTFGRNDLVNGAQLNSITVMADNSPVSNKTFNLSYGVFNSNTVEDNSAPCGLGIANSDYLRLQLRSIQEVGDGISIPPYKFEYDPKILPQKKSRSQDHWGYYNGANNTSLIPQVTYSNKTVGSADRSAKNDFMKACSLKKIAYPTGGYTEFDFEAHPYEYTSPDIFTLESPYRLDGVNSTEASSVNKTDSWPKPYICEVDNACTLTYGNKAQINIVFATVANEDGSPKPYINDPRFKISKNGNTLIEVVFQPSYPNYYNPENGMVYHTYSTSLHTPDIQLNGYDVFLLTSTDERNHITATIKVEASYEETVKEVLLGGLRIQEIRSYNKDKNIVKAEAYEYSPAQLNSGLDYRTHYENNDAYYRVYKETHQSYSPEGGNTINCPTNYFTFMQVSDKPLSGLAGGGAVSYEQVTKYNETHDQKTKSRIVSTYKIPKDNLINSYPYPPAYSNAWKRGILSNKKLYNGDDIIVSEEEHLYSLETINQMEGMKVGFSDDYILGRCFESYDLSDYTIIRFDLNSVWHKKQSSTYTDYSDGLAKATTYSYEYANPKHAQMTRMEVSNGEKKLRYEYTYPSDYNNISSSNDGIISLSTLELAKMTDKNILTPKVESRILTVNNNEAAIIAAVYKEFVEGKPSKVYRLPVIDNPIPDAGFSRSEETDLDPRYELHTSIAYDNGNVNYLMSLDGIPKSYQWDSQHQLISETLNAMPDQLFYTGFEDASEYAAESKSGNYSHSGSYLVARPSGVGNYILSYWEKSHTSATWQYKEMAMTDPSITIGGTDKIIDEVRIIPVGALMTTYTYDQLNGTSSITDHNSESTQYIYDGLGRLNHIKDSDSNIVEYLDYVYSGN